MSGWSKEWGGSAFPAEGGSDSALYPYPGMSLRDYFASAAMQGALVNATSTSDQYDILAEGVALIAYKIADAMLKEREK